MGGASGWAVAVSRNSLPPNEGRRTDCGWAAKMSPGQLWGKTEKTEEKRKEEEGGVFNKNNLKKKET